MKATTIVGSRALRPFSGAAKHVKEKLEHLSKDYTEKGNEEVAQRIDKHKERRKLRGRRN